MLKHKKLADLRNFPKDSKYFCNDNKKVPGKMKNEYGGTALYKFIGTKSKMYSICDVNNSQKSVLRDIVQILDIMNLWMFFLIKKLLGTL